uniref:hypothetical protein n=1 Tax=Clostridium sp. NkU-1 TaxID=1095009 RepID=UPI0006D22000
MIEGVPSISNEEIRKIGLSEIGFCNYQIICNLIRSEFVKDVGMGTEYLYNITNLIKDMFDAENSIEGFIYSSIRNYEHKNCALKPFIAQKLLKCTGCLYGKLVDFSDSGETAIIKPMKRTLSTITNNKCVEYESFHGNGHIKLKMS